jgi:hypothetical protein
MSGCTKNHYAQKCNCSENSTGAAIKDFTGPLSLENLEHQFCSDWLKDQIRGLLIRVSSIENENEQLKRKPRPHLVSPTNRLVWNCQGHRTHNSKCDECRQVTKEMQPDFCILCRTDLTVEKGLRDALEVAANRLEGVSLAISKHGQNINTKFFIDEYALYATRAREALE